MFSLLCITTPISVLNTCNVLKGHLDKEVHVMCTLPTYLKGIIFCRIRTTCTSLICTTIFLCLFKTINVIHDMSEEYRFPNFSNFAAQAEKTKCLLYEKKKQDVFVKHKCPR